MSYGEQANDMWRRAKACGFYGESDLKLIREWLATKKYSLAEMSKLIADAESRV